MAKLATLIFIYADIFIALGFYAYLLGIKKRIGFQLGMNISIVMGGMTAMLAGVLLISQYPFHFTLITIISTLIGLGVGALFGLLFDYQTFVTGLTNGMVIGIMAPMIGTVIEMPSVFIIFIHGLFALCLLAISISIRRA
ncbi:hypothetical protein JSQ81_08510 [Sporosarcina sp. Marseille-Q4063]|uniref:hypothetical protein n=1 Tax=Sporosarcina sp. Marseille-Q4063 TaxID=2810514 RepID=UPI001BB0365B|nr:hypothetical protein [Sporosarcina sp. Marseille-Q4063]QUW23526.1 hypothetical protein JSQ81_08510 [Sporosarcina sp. Marseille-Q4063]